MTGWKPSVDTGGFEASVATEIGGRERTLTSMSLQSARPARLPGSERLVPSLEKSAVRAEGKKVSRRDSELREFREKI